ncbi:MAG: hypothetical protein JKY22_12015 [Flavobacteriaceae bacterium]|nr:hypothetical protein [Flavobacteriaceae bacterium]PCJ26475.1 MAG: hypothetical protein COA94_05040 [Rickettsiales bacterium]
MALGTPVDRGTATRNYSSNSDISVASFTPDADDFLLAYVAIEDGNSTEPTMSGQDDGISWARIGDIETATLQHGVFFGAAVGSSPSSGVVTAAHGTTVGMTLQVTSISSVDVSGTVANALLQNDQGGGYASSLTLTLTDATALTVGGWSVFGNTVIPEGTEINGTSVDQLDTSMDYDASGDASPSASVSSGNTYFVGFAVELKEAGGATYPLEIQEFTKFKNRQPILGM